MKLFKTYLLIFVSVMCLFNCKKYPEGGCERRAPKNILGLWKLSLYEVNGIDSTDLINYMGDEIYKKVSILKNASTLSVNYEGFSGNAAALYDKNTTITFYSEGEGLKCTLYNNINYCYRSFLTPEDSFTTWEILKLTSKEVIIKCTLNNSYKIKLVK